MTKARILANLISDNAELADGQISVAEVVGAAPLASPTFTGTVTTAAVTMNGYLTVNGGGVDVNTVIYPNGIAMEDSRAISFGTGADFELSSGGTFLDHNLKDNARHLRIINGLTEHHRFSGDGSVIFNNSGADANFLVKSDNNDHMLFLNAGNDRIGIANSAPTTTLDVSGTITADNFTNVDLSPIASTISDTAVDVFVYDTSKDSDGGAWRKRTQHTSWYNEAASSTRGSRKEFPAVAVIVLENYALSIYDGDDPDLPLWKEMIMTSAANTYWFGFGAGYPFPKAVSALNGEISLVNNDAGNSSAGLTRVRFIQDDIYRNAYSISYSGKYEYNISNYSTTNGSYDQNANIIVSNRSNDVAMTVLPNAPIDAATGLPAVTTAVATDGGTSVIKDDGTVVDITGFQPVENVNFSGDKLAINTPVSSNSFINIGPSTLSTDTTSSAWKEVEINSTNTNDFKVLTNTANHQVFDNTYYSAGSNGLLAVLPDYAAPQTSLYAYTTSSYATGHMVGDTKLATLSDTSTTNVTGSDLVGSATLYATARITSRTYTAGSSTVGIDDAEATVDGYVGLTMGGLTSGKVYTVTIVGNQTYTPTTNYFNFISVNDSTNYVIDGALQGTTTPQSITFTAGSTNRIYFYSGYSGGTINYTWTLRLAEEDRSVNNNGLQVFGTVTKTAVATGADLVAYSGFSSSNYLKQPYNSDLNFGTGDFTYSFWASAPSSGTDRLWLTHGKYNTAKSGLNILQYNSGGSGDEAHFYVGNAGAGYVVVTGIEGTGLHNWAVVRKSGTLEVYRDGKLAGSVANTNDINLSNEAIKDLYVGVGLSGSSVYNYGAGTLALLRISATAASPEQIAKIYEDEKVLFQENAQATLYGSSDAVTALAYDDSTELLHVGTSAGRSVFQGLRRVDNTTTAVSAAISASNNLVGEQ